MNRAQKRTFIVVAAMTVFTAACAKKQVAATPPPAPAPVATAASTPKPAPAPARVSPAPLNAVNNNAPASRFPNAVTRARIDQLLAKISDAYFDYDRAALRSDALKALEGDSTELRNILKDYPDYKLTIEGYCDERGSAEYNIALGDKRAQAAKDYLVQVGIPSAQLNVVSYGKEREVCTEHDEACWQRNRRIHIVAMAQTR